MTLATSSWIPLTALVGSLLGLVSVAVWSCADRLRALRERALARLARFDGRTARALLRVIDALALLPWIGLALLWSLALRVWIESGALPKPRISQAFSSGPLYTDALPPIEPYAVHASATLAVLLACWFGLFTLFPILVARLALSRSRSRWSALRFALGLAAIAASAASAAGGATIAWIAD